MTRAFALPMVLWLAASMPSNAQEVTKVVNGETIEVEGVGKIRLVGIDAGESGHALRTVRSCEATPIGPGPAAAAADHRKHRREA